MTIDRGLADWVDGAWTRAGRSIDGGVSIEPSEVLWLTAGRYYVDIRQFCGSIAPHSLDKTQAFSGEVLVANGVVTWRHDLDTMSRPVGEEDANPVHGTSDDLVEVGENYEEFWHRVDKGLGFRAVAELASETGEDDARVVLARVVMVDDRAIAIWCQPMPGAALFVESEMWRCSLLIGHEFQGDLNSVVLALADAGVLPDGWSLVEHRNR